MLEQAYMFDIVMILVFAVNQVVAEVILVITIVILIVFLSIDGTNACVNIVNRKTEKNEYIQVMFGSWVGNNNSYKNT